MTLRSARTSQRTKNNDQDHKLRGKNEGLPQFDLFQERLVFFRNVKFAFHKSAIPAFPTGSHVDIKVVPDLIEIVPEFGRLPAIEGVRFSQSKLIV